MIHAEISGGRLARSALELLGLGRSLADGVGGRLVAAVLGPGARAAAPEAVRYGADAACWAEAERYTRFPQEAALAALSQLCAERQPAVVLLAHGWLGRDLAPLLADRLGVGLASDCTSVLFEEGELRGIKPIYGGKLVALLAPAGPPALFTLRQRSVDPATADDARRGEIAAFEATLDVASLRVELVAEEAEESGGEVDIEDAEVLVSGGRGMGDAASFNHLQELATLLGGTISGSLPTIEAGWLPVSRQVGLSGKVVKPRLYIAVGISGAMQHQAGMSGTRTIVAINPDERAPIFRLAHFGVVGRWQDVLPGFTRKVAELVAA